MGRWEPDARGRLMRAALELYADGGFEQTTVADIADRAGVTERTFFRHFTDKREVLFDKAFGLQEFLVEAIRAAPAERSPVDVVAEAFAATGPMFEERREWAGRRANVIATNPSLQERELLKMAALGAAAAGALRERGTPEPAASIAAEAGVALFRVAFEAWAAAGTGELDDLVRESLAHLKVLTTAGGS